MARCSNCGCNRLNYGTNSWICENCGTVVLPSYVEPVIATSDGVEHPVKFCHGGIDISLAEFRKDHPELSEDEIREKYWKHDF